MHFVLNPPLHLSLSFLPSPFHLFTQPKYLESSSDLSHPCSLQKIILSPVKVFFLKCFPSVPFVPFTPLLLCCFNVRFSLILSVSPMLETI